MMSSRKLNRFLPGTTSQVLIRVKSKASPVLAIQAQVSMGGPQAGSIWAVLGPGLPGGPLLHGSGALSPSFNLASV